MEDELCWESREGCHPFFLFLFSLFLEGGGSTKNIEIYKLEIYRTGSFSISAAAGRGGGS